MIFERAKKSTPVSMHSPHTHKEYELYFLIEGSMKYFVGNELFILNSGDFIFIPKGVFHQTSYNQNGKTERFLFSFDDTELDHRMSPVLEALCIDKKITVNPEKLYKIKRLINIIENENKKNAPDSELFKKILLEEILVLILRYKKSPDISLSESHKTIQDIAKYITENVGGDLSLSTLSRLFLISPNHLSNRFKKLTGIGLNEYINITRIEKAERLLSDKSLSVTEVATLCGFNDSNYFAAVFKKLKGITPKKYAMLNK